MVNQLLLFGLGVCPQGMFNFTQKFGKETTYKTLFEKETNENLIWFFSAYLNQPTCPSFFISELPHGNTKENKVKNILYIKKNLPEYIGKLLRFI